MLAWLTTPLIVYFLVSNAVFLTLLVASFIAIRKMIFARPMIESIWKRTADFGPPISLIAPSYNEEKTIIASVRSFLGLDYPKHEVIIVNDGSTDQTLERLKHEFKLLPASIYFDDRLSKTKIRETYRSQLYQNLIVVDKVNGGKADSINVGIGYSSTDIFCAVDADCILDRDALLKVVLPFVEDPETTLAAGGTIRPVNGSAVKGAKVLKPMLPANPVVLFQIVEYLRAFLFGRVGWNLFNSTMIISGAFGIFNREAVVQVGGYKEGSVGEDMELVVRLRKWAGDHDRQVSISFIPDPICWTEVPGDLLTLGRQRDRWQRGLADSLLTHRKMFFNPRYGLAGLLAYPSFFFFELIQPIVELLAYIIIFTGWVTNQIPGEMIYLFFIVDILFGMLMSFGAVLIEESAFHKYPKIHQLFILLGVSLFENLGFRQYVMFWRIVGCVRYFFGAREWGKMQREGFDIHQVSKKIK